MFKALLVFLLVLAVVNCQWGHHHHGGMGGYGMGGYGMGGYGMGGLWCSHSIFSGYGGMMGGYGGYGMGGMGGETFYPSK